MLTSQNAGRASYAPALTVCLLANAVFGPELRDASAGERDLTPPAVTKTDRDLVAPKIPILPGGPQTSMASEARAFAWQGLDKIVGETKELTKTREGRLGLAAGLLTFAGAALYVLQTMKNGCASRAGWAVSAVNEVLIFGTAAVLGTLENLALQIGGAIGTVAGCVASQIYAPRKPLTLLEKVFLAGSVVGWSAMLMNMHDPIFAACAAQLVSLGAAFVFAKYQYDNPKQITVSGQLCFLAGAAVNLYAMTDLTMRTFISPVGAYMTCGICAIGLFTGRFRERFVRPEGESRDPPPHSS